jgi:hypothetical protein
MIISLDIESYGAVKCNWLGEELPMQTVFNPIKGVCTDGVKTEDLIVNVAITLPKDPEGHIEDIHDLAQLEPGETMVFQMHKAMHRKRLQAWLQCATTIIGMNLQFDITWLMNDLQFRKTLVEEQALLVDLSVLNYLHDETRPERSLKAIGPVLNTHVYRDEDTLKHQRFEGPGNKLDFYVASDTHNTLLAVRELSRRIIGDYHQCGATSSSASVSPADPLLPGFGSPGRSSKGSARCLRHYSDVAWTAIRMVCSGFAMDRPGLLALERRLLARIKRTADVASSLGVKLSGPGSGKDKQRFMDGCVRQAVKRHGPKVMDGFEISEKKKLVGYKDVNRHHLLNLLPRDHMRSRVLRIMELHSKAVKLHSSYVFPLLHHRKNHPSDKKSKLVKYRDAWMAYPTWYITPSPTKDGGGDSGGTVQGRITCKSPSRQTFPKQISRLCRSRWGRGWSPDFDLSQIELRVAGVLSGEPALVGAYQEERDLHRERAQQIFEQEEISNAQRQVGKMVNFADLFESSAETMQAQVLAMTGIEMPLSLFRHIQYSRPEHRPVLTEWQKALKAWVNKHHYLELPIIGQSRWYVGGVSGKNKHEIVNQPIQTLAGNVLLEIQHNLGQRIPHPLQRAPAQTNVHQTCQVYDAVYLDCHPGVDVEWLRGVIQEAVTLCETQGIWAELQDLTGHRVPLKYDLEGFPPERSHDREPEADPRAA